MTIRALDQDAMHAARMKQMSILGNLSTKLRDVTSQLATSLHEIIAKRPDLRRSSTSRPTTVRSRSYRRR